MLLNEKVAVVYGAAGSVGSTIARVFAEESAVVHLVGRTRDSLDRVADDIRAAGHRAEVATLDASKPDEVDAHLESIGRVDVTVNATSLHGELQGTPLREMDVEDYVLPTVTALRTNFAIGTAAARRMTAQGSGAILTLSTSASALSGRDRRYHATGGFGTACAAIEEFTRSLAGEVGPHGVRVVCLRPDALPESWGDPGELEDNETFHYMTAGTALDRMPTLRQVADAAAFAASDRAGAMTGAIFNLTSGSVMS
ncbi:NAD(P)-dependent dehydrogenase (short-subunit alcohol dehydrogenase family) [Diaminobutyricimonas aerilata]|uniref:NAD(P)-dependent dehydrogenase (Short-subunit alcohol dehydrogenase family) n=1 Tax=Diaminobutyricimonas aerilata TaxID=1162967 RepID=A0A2M9CI45_9MICO|nr:SDR family oxidoreductase [Diaminobutyricimonas aerilata]PJJ71539.1 NAD(P)-dependent dehydrogenase (short-subunit alcohol dehydrogenase family) [Diaminobutyricimonas aerilata]